ncbi:uncharacterized protein LOC129793651 [Lutzomyia longipalpis]|uniref:uncharacterized protein LOC129793651 n=1 Tax=Lutzomyia longipalpis TaxID=7200 RepID=UPI00248433D0|nr:uncharacterized protein LOC129793651 [Lutzomyia longipalpis]
MAIRDFIPEAFVILHFFHCGVWQSLTIYLPSQLFGINQFMPQILGIIASLGVSIIFFSFKIHSKKIRFVHFALLGIGNIFFVINGCYFALDHLESIKGLYFGGVGHGITYITGLSYMHFRLATNEFRIFKLGLCHVVYLIGIVSTVHGIELMSADLEKIFTQVHPMITCPASINFFTLLINEVLHAGGLFDYKMCRDEEVNAANEKGTLLTAALEFSPVPKAEGRNFTQTTLQQEAALQQPNIKRQVFLTMLMIFAKLKNYMASHLIFINFFVFFSEDFFQVRSYFVMHYLILSGAIAGIFITLKGNMRSIYVVSAICVCICVLVVMIFKLTSVFLVGLYSLPIILLYFHLGVSYFIPDCSIMEVSSLKCTELSLAGGYVAEGISHMITIATIKCSEFNQHESFWHSSVIFVAILSAVCAMMFKWLPKTWCLSILDVQHLVLFNENRWKPQLQN